MLEDACPFCSVPILDIVYENELAITIRDLHPVKKLHTLILTKRHCSNIFETTAEEREALHQLAIICKQDIQSLDTTVAGFNYGSNVFAAAGQKVFHTHVHLIPRRAGDIPPPPASQ